ncbi:NUDIX domain-containing protein [Streptomyces roseicoloratus]
MPPDSRTRLLLPGGEVDPGESIEQAAVRELAEGPFHRYDMTPRR